MVLKKIALTGSSGLLGRHLIFLLLKKKYYVIATSRKAPPIKNKMLKFIRLDLSKNLDIDKLDKTFKRVSTIVHAGAHVPHGKNINLSYIKKCNLRATQSIARWAYKRNIHLIYISGAIIYKNQNYKNRETSKKIYKVKDKYRLLKVLSEKNLTIYKKKGLKLTIFRPTSIYGWGLKKNKIISKILYLAKRGKKIKIYKPLNNKVNLIHASDVALAIVKSLENNLTGIFNLGNKLENFSQIVQIVKKIFKKKSKVEIFNKKKLFVANKLNVDINLAKKFLNWKPKISLRNGLALMSQKRCY